MTDKHIATERPKFRFMDLEIWQDSIEVAGVLFDIADRLDARRLYRFAEQLRGSGLSMSNPVKYHVLRLCFAEPEGQ